MSNLERDKETFDFLWHLVKAGEIAYFDDSSPYFKKLVQKFPIGFYRIDWEKIPHKSIWIEESYPQNKSHIEHYVGDLLKHLDKSSSVFIVFDGYNRGAFSMNIELFIELASEILTFPQHNYVFPENFEWCLNYSMENELCFGYSAQ